jgi:hypothetical protein
MKKLTFAAAIAAAAISSPSFAQAFGTSDTDTTTITAEIDLVCTIGAPEGGDVEIDATTAIGDSSAQCNDPDGFTATLTSANAGKLVGADEDNATVIPYTITIAGAGTYSLAAPQELPREPGDQQAVDGFSLPTSVNVAEPVGPAFADAYSDTITYEIVPN